MAEHEQLAQERREAVDRAAQFARRVRDDMENLDRQIADLQAQQDALDALLTHINSVGGTRELLVDLGCGVHAEATLQKTRTLFVGVGLGFFLEASADEALAIADKRRRFLDERIDTLLREMAQKKALLVCTEQGSAALAWQLNTASD